MRNLKIIGIALIILIPSLGIYLVTKEYIPAIAMATAITTATMAIINFLYLRQLRESLTREIKEKIYSPLYNQLKAFLLPNSHTQEDIQTGTLPFSWPWMIIKDNQYYLAYQIPKKIFTQLNDFTKTFDEYKKYFEFFLKEVRKILIQKLQKTNPNIDDDTVLRIEMFLPKKNGGIYFNSMFGNLFWQKEIPKTIKDFKAENKIGTNLTCKFLNGRGEIIHFIENEEVIVQFFEKLFKDIRDNSENFKELLRLRQVGMNSAKQILKQISPE